MRSILQPLAGRTVFAPIETIVFFAIVGTLAYFQVLSAIKHSSFFAPSVPSTLRPAHALLRDGEWVGVDEDWYLKRVKTADSRPLELQQLIFSLDPAQSSATVTADSAPVDLVSLSQSIDNITHHIVHGLSTPLGETYTSLCYYPVTGQSLLPASCFTTASLQTSRSKTVTLSFAAGASDAFVDALNHQPAFTADEFGVRYQIETHVTETIGEMKGGKWMAYAARALIVRKPDSLDILLVLIGYILMHASFIRLLAILSSSILAFMLALPISHYLEIPLDPISLTEALPFFVCTVGFDKPLRLAAAVFNHPHLLSPVKEGRWRGQMKPAGEVVMEAIENSGNAILRDYALEIAVLSMGAKSKVGGLKEFCALAALTLTLDCVLFGTFYAAMLAIMVEVRRIKAARDMTRSRSSNNLSERKPSALVRSPPQVQDASLSRQLSETLLGVKGSMLRQKNSPPPEVKEENPLARLKLLLIVSFLTVHILNFATTLTPATISRYQTQTLIDSARADYPVSHRVDITSPAIASVLANLAAIDATLQVEVEVEANVSTPTDLLVKIAPPLYIRVTPPGPVRPRALFRSTEAIENFMTGWTTLVGDPILSKWIVLVLAVSVALNGYLLKGIAEGAMRGLQPNNVRFRSVVAEKREKDDEEIVTPGVRAVGGRRRSSFVVGDSKPPSPSSSDSEKPIVRPLAIRPMRVLAPIAIPATAGVSAQMLDMKLRAQAAPAPREDQPIQFPIRSLEQCIEVFENGPRPVSAALATLNDEEVVMLAQNGKIAAYALEKVLGDLERAVTVRRALISRATDTKSLEYSDIPMHNYDYSRVVGACCENVVGYIPIPLGVAGPLNIDGELVHIPMATAEGTLVASTSRGCKALNAGGGVTTVLTNDAMTRGPAIDFPSIIMAAEAKAWIDSEEGFEIIREAFESTSRFAKLQRLKTAMAGPYPIRSGNYCTDKKPAAINWIEGRGKSVVAEAVIPGKVVKSVLKTTVEALCNLNTKKNLVGSAMAGSIGGFNAHAANILTAVFLATGQDPAQNVESSNCMTLMEPTNDGEDLLMTVSMPSIEVGTVGGGTVLGPQGSVLEMLGIKGAHPTTPGHNAQRLACIIAASVMAGELSLLSALAAGHLVRAHLVHNRSQANTPTSSRPVTPGLIASDIVWEQKTAEKSLGPRPDSVLTHSLSTTSLPPYTANPETEAETKPSQ
ncbi:hypothetical protein EV424DRAFT_1417143 [Suillus variegatus]|nr:hypothetical protein EV424DRAFT_1417143 [Suillus variegatus]